MPFMFEKCLIVQAAMKQANVTQSFPVNMYRLHGFSVEKTLLGASARVAVSNNYIQHQTSTPLGLWCLCDCAQTSFLKENSYSASQLC